MKTTVKFLALVDALSEVRLLFPRHLRDISRPDWLSLLEVYFDSTSGAVEHLEGLRDLIIDPKDDAATTAYKLWAHAVSWTSKMHRDGDRDHVAESNATTLVADAMRHMAGMLNTIIFIHDHPGALDPGRGEPIDPAAPGAIDPDPNILIECVQHTCEILCRASEFGPIETAAEIALVNKVASLYCGTTEIEEVEEELSDAINQHEGHGGCASSYYYEALMWLFGYILCRGSLMAQNTFRAAARAIMAAGDPKAAVAFRREWLRRFDTAGPAMVH